MNNIVKLEYQVYFQTKQEVKKEDSFEAAAEESIETNKCQKQMLNPSGESVFYAGVEPEQKPVLNKHLRIAQIKEK